VVGKNAAVMYQGWRWGTPSSSAGGTWTSVGIFDAGVSVATPSLGDATVVNRFITAGEMFFQSITVHLTSSDAMAAFKDRSRSILA